MNALRNKTHVETFLIPGSNLTAYKMEYRVNIMIDAATVDYPNL
jgi:hypothetical protein